MEEWALSSQVFLIKRSVVLFFFFFNFFSIVSRLGLEIIYLEVGDPSVGLACLTIKEINCSGSLRVKT